MIVKTLKIMLVAGEASGDAHAARLVNAIRQRAGTRPVQFFGSAGPRMRDAGIEPTVRADDLSIVGLLEIAKALPKFWAVFKRLKQAARDECPDVAVLVDFPDFNLRLAKALKKQGIRVVYYISPQVWGWRKHRRSIIRDHVDMLLTILPFEEDWYGRYGIRNVRFIGNPLTNEVKASRSREEFCSEHQLDSARPIVALLPGSRRKELSRILPPMLETAALMQGRRAELQFVVALAPTRTRQEVADIVASLATGARRPQITVVRDETYDALNAADAAAVASGTATLEAGIIGTPMAIVYRTSAVNFALLRPLISVEYFGLINLIAGERVAAELIQHDFTPASLAAELDRLLEPAANRNTRESLRMATAKLGEGGASRRAAAAILELVNKAETQMRSEP